MSLYFNANEYKADYEDSVLKYLEKAIKSWEDENEIDYSHYETYELLQELCKATVSSLLSDPVESESLRELFDKTSIQIKFGEDEDYDGPGFDEFAEAELAKKTVGMIASGATNLWDLFAILARIQEKHIPAIPLKYLKHVLRCYVWGLKPECIILCRSVLDVAVHDIITDELCKKYGGSLQKNFSFDDRIKIIKKLKLLDKDSIKRVDKIRCRGNKCVHGDMEAVQDIEGTIIDTFKALIALCEVKL